MPLEELLAMYPRVVANPPTEKVPEDETEEMEEDEDGESVQSSSSNKSKTVENQVNESKPSKKTRSELHLLYQEGEVPEATRLLRSAGAGNTASDDDGDEEEDQDYAPGEDEWRKVSEPFDICGLTDHHINCVV